MSIIVPTGSSPQSSSHNLELYHALDATSRADFQQQVTKRYILAKDIKNYENELKQKMDASQVEQPTFPSEKNPFSSQKHQPLSLIKGIANINYEQPKMSYPSAKSYFQAPQSLDSRKLAASKLDNLQPIEPKSKQKVEDSCKEKNIFLEKNNPINRSFYKEFNIGPRLDQDGKLVQYTLVGNPSWYIKQRELLERTGKLRTQGSLNKNSDDEMSNKGKTSNSSFFYKQSNMQSSKSIRQKTENEKSFSNNRPETTSSFLVKTQPASTVKKKKRAEQTVEMSKEDAIKEFNALEKRQEQQLKSENNIISKMALDNRNLFTREQRVLKSFEHHQGDWDKLVKKMTELSSREPETSCMLRGEEHRKKLEFFEAFDSLKTEDERFGKRIWYMQLRKYPKENKKPSDENNQSSKSTLRQRTQDHFESKETLQTMSSKQSMGNGSRRLQNKLKNMFETNDKTQSDIFSGFNTVIINDEDKEIEVIRRAQDPSHFHLSQVPYQKPKKNDSQSLMEIKVKDFQTKLKDKIIVLNQPIDDFMIVGKNKLKAEKESILKYKNKIFIRSLAISNPDGTETDLQQNTQQASQSQEIIDQDYNMNELSKTGNMFFPSLVNKLQNSK